MPRPRHAPGRAPIDAPGRRRLPPLLRRAWYSLNQAFRRRIAHLGRLTPDQFTVLRTLTEHDQNGVAQCDLTGIMSSDPNTIASLLERMEDAGLLERRRHERDRRAYRIRLKPAGQHAFREARRAALTLQAEILAALPEDKREEFLTHLAIVADACHVAAENSPKRAR